VGGGVVCWGDNTAGQLGSAVHFSSATPQDVALQGVTTIATGGYHSCAVSNARLHCWGGGWAGQLGVGDNDTRTAPKEVLSISDVVEVAAGEQHTCARDGQGQVHCWGINERGQLGQGGFGGQENTPLKVTSLAGQVAALSTWGSSTCALKTDRTIECWGANEDGQLGNGSSNDSALPVPVVNIDDALAVSVGGRHACAIREDQGRNTAWCWGGGWVGQLGNLNSDNSDTPVPVHEMESVTAISAGWYYTCALKDGGALWCWGENDFRQLGPDASSSESSRPVRVPAVAFDRISAGSAHACGRTPAGEVQCWGANDYAQLGDGKADARATLRPVKILPPP
jgi:alpha-tubulin suppressor-like RCC1 family protein